jgi:hypothetical protein
MPLRQTNVSKSLALSRVPVSPRCTHFNLSQTIALIEGHTMARASRAPHLLS